MQHRVRLLLLCLLWLLAAWPPLLWLLHANDPEAAVRLVITVRQTTLHALGALLVLLLVGCALFPPLPAGIHLFGSRLWSSMTSDRGPLLRAQEQLRHVETAAGHLEVGRLALRLGDPRNAGPHLVRAVELDPSVTGARFQLGLWLLRLGRVAEAQQQFAAVVAADPGHAFGDALLQLGRCAHQLGDDRTAAELLRRHAKEHGGNRQSHYLLAVALRGVGDEAGARDAFAFAAAPVPRDRRLPAEERWFRALARVRLWRTGRRS